MKRRQWVIFFILGTIFYSLLGFPFSHTLKSYIFMPIYDLQMVKNSTLHQKNILFFIPGGLKTKEKDWYPYMLHHNASKAFSNFLGKKVSLDILYTFGHFDFWEGSSSFYDPHSPYEGAFYGGYALFTEDPAWKYGFQPDGHIHMEEIEKIPMFDQTYLVLPSIGLSQEKALFQTKIKEISYGQEYINKTDWVKIDAEILTNSPYHVPKDMKLPGYYQYGRPLKSEGSSAEYPTLLLKGRIYARYFKEYGGTFFLYIMSSHEVVLEECDEKLLSKASIIRHEP